MQTVSSQSVTDIQVGSRQLATHYVLAPLAGYTHLAFRVMLRRLGGVGLATTDLVQARMLLSETRKSLELVATTDEDRPLSVQIFRSTTLLNGSGKTTNCKQTSHAWGTT